MSRNLKRVPYHRLVADVNDHLGPVALNPGLQRRHRVRPAHHRHPVDRRAGGDGVSAYLLRATQEHRGRELVASTQFSQCMGHDRRIVLSVDEGQRARARPGPACGGPALPGAPTRLVFHASPAIRSSWKSWRT